ncbi:MAG: hypothetical protein H0W25_10175 [Acidimicrobiia bacterium]|nr:hypothetical protein [Acidimicrobiia bacterium]
MYVFQRDLGVLDDPDDPNDPNDPDDPDDTFDRQGWDLVDELRLIATSGWHGEPPTAVPGCCGG